MKKTKSVILVILVMSMSMFAKGQIVRDTTNAACMYVTDSAKFVISTGWLKKVTTYEYQFLQQQTPPGVDSFTVKKTKIPVKAEYYWVLPPAKYVQAKVLVEFKYP